MKIINIGYNIYINSDININSILNEINESSYVFVVTSRNIYNLYNQFLNKKIDRKIIYIFINDKEKFKNNHTTFKIIKKLLKYKIKKNDILISFGGGIISDITGYVASILYRGIKYISIPTTLTSQVDASIGSKCGINLYKYKNIIGQFYDPYCVIIYTDILKTLKDFDLESGLGEIYKYYLISKNETLKEFSFSNIENIVYECLLIKKYYIGNDYLDLNKRHILNFGHTFGHVIERISKNKISHGKAVFIGMLYSMKLAEFINLDNFNKKLLNDNLLNKYRKYLFNFKISDFLYDKKSEYNYINFIFIEDIGKPIIKKIKLEVLNEFINKKI